MSEFKVKDKVRYKSGTSELEVLAVDGRYLWLKSDLGGRFTEGNPSLLEKIPEKWKVNTWYRNRHTKNEYYVVHVFKNNNAVVVWGDTSYSLLLGTYINDYDKVERESN